MFRREDKTASRQLKLTVFGVSAAVVLALPTASLALVGLNLDRPDTKGSSHGIFTPASVDPELASRVAARAQEDGLRFTPAGINSALRDKTVTVAVRVDIDSANVIAARNAIQAQAGLGSPALSASRFNLGTARGYESFAQPTALPETLRDLSMPDLSRFEPAQPTAIDKPSLLKPRIELEDERVAGRSENTREYLGQQTVDLGGSLRISSKVDMTAGVRFSQERERLRPLTNSAQDSQSVYVGTQIKF